MPQIYNISIKKAVFYRKYNIFQIQSNDTMVTTNKVSHFFHAS